MMSELLRASALSVCVLVVSFSNIRTTFALPRGGESCHLWNIGGFSKSNIFAWNDPANASSVYDDDPKWQVTNAFDDDEKTSYFSKKESNPWLFVDLQKSHLILEISVDAYNSPRTGGLTVYLAEDVSAFFKDGKLDVDKGKAQLFGHQAQNSDSEIVTFNRPDGMCGRYVLLEKIKMNHYLTVREIQGTGYVLP